MPNQHQIIFIEPLAPPKPPLGEACNGCGLCCLAQPCPLGIVLSGRRQGACSALRWSADALVYRCGAVVQPDAMLRAVLPVALHYFAGRLGPVLAVLAKRAIAVEVGCDSSLEMQHPPPTGRRR